MHKGIILLTKNPDIEGTVDQFMNDNPDVWDWWVIGGRWNQTLSPFKEKFGKIAKDIIKSDKGFISMQDIEDHQTELQTVWENLGATGQNPYTDHYKLPREAGNTYDIVPLSDCIDIVRDWHQTPKDGIKAEEEARKWLDGTKATNNYDMYGFALQEAVDIYKQTFSNNCNVYNIDTWNYSIPKDLEGWTAVMIDIHF